MKNKNKNIKFNDYHENEEEGIENSLNNLLNGKIWNSNNKTFKGINDDTIRNLNSFEDLNFEAVIPQNELFENIEKRKKDENDKKTKNLLNNLFKPPNSQNNNNNNKNNNKNNILDLFKKNFKNIIDKNTQDKKKNKTPWYLITPKSKKLAVWNFINLILILYSITFINFYVVFDENSIKFYVQITEIVIDSFFLLDLIKNFFLCYNNTKNELITDLKKIIIHYFFTWFFIDSLTSIPLTIIYFNDKKERNFVKILKIIRILKFLKICNSYFNFISKKLILKPYIKRIFSSSIIILLLFHAISCIWIITSNLYNLEKNWIKENNKRYSSQFEIYLTALYWTIQTIFTVGYGDIGAFNAYERFVAIIVMFIGVFIYSFLVGSISSIINLFSNDKDNLNNNKQILRQIQKKYNLKVKFIKKIEKYLKENTKIVGNKEELISELPIKTKNELNYQMNQYMLSGIYYFENKSKEFKGFISPNLRLIQFNKGDVVYNQNESSNEIYFLKKGKIIFKKLYKKKFIDILILRNGIYFGELEILSGNIDRMHKVIAYTDIEVLALSYSVVQESFFKYFPDVGKELIELGIERKQKFQNIFEERKLNLIKRRIIEKDVLLKYKIADIEIFLKNRLFYNVIKNSNLKR